MNDHIKFSSFVKKEIKNMTKSKAIKFWKTIGLMTKKGNLTKRGKIVYRALSPTN